MKIRIVDNKEVSWADFKSLRLEALKLNPTAFGRSYEEALVQEDDEWKQRLKTGNYHFSLCDKNFVGMISYRRFTGPKTHHIFEINAFFVKPDFQGKGLGRKLLEKTLGKINNERGAHKVKIFATAGNHAAIKLYESVGFQLVGVQKDELLVNGEFYDEMEFEMIFN